MYNIPPGPLSEQTALVLTRLLADMEHRVGSSVQPLPIDDWGGGIFSDNQVPDEVLNQPFFAKITAGPDGSGFYTWEPVVGTATASWAANTGIFDGSPSLNPLYEANGATVSTDTVWQIRRSYFDGTLDWVYVFNAGSGGGGSLTAETAEAGPDPAYEGTFSGSFDSVIANRESGLHATLSGTTLALGTVEANYYLGSLYVGVVTGNDQNWSGRKTVSLGGSTTASCVTIDATGSTSPFVQVKWDSTVNYGLLGPGTLLLHARDQPGTQPFGDLPFIFGAGVDYFQSGVSCYGSEVGLDGGSYSDILCGRIFDASGFIVFGNGTYIQAFGSYITVAESNFSVNTGGLGNIYKFNADGVDIEDLINGFGHGFSGTGASGDNFIDGWCVNAMPGSAPQFDIPGNLLNGLIN